MALITTFNKSKFNKKDLLTQNTLFKYPYIYNIVGGNNVLNIYRKDVINKTSELYGSIDVHNVIPTYYNSVIRVYGVTRSENTKYMYVVLGSQTESDYYSFYLCYVDIENLVCKQLYFLFGEYSNNVSGNVKINVRQINNEIYAYINYIKGYWDDSWKRGSWQIFYYVHKLLFNNDIFESKEIVHSTASNTSSGGEKLNIQNCNSIPSIINSDYKFLKYGAKTQSGNYITKAGFTDYQNPSTYDTYNNEQYYGNLILEFNNKYYVIGGYIGSNPNTNILELNKNNLEATIVYETTSTSSIYMSYVYENNMYIVYTDGTDAYLLTVSLKEYNLKYNISSNDGSKQYVELLNNAPIKAITFNNVSGTNIVGYIIETLSDTLQGSFEIDEIQNKQLSGFSTIVNATTIQIPLNQRVEINISLDTTFYTVYTTYRPLANTFKLDLYNNTSEDNRVDKTNYLTKVGELSGVLREESSLIDMSLTLEIEQLPLFNYVYIEQLNRYYYVTDIVSVKYKLWTISLSVDVLMSYKNALLSCSAFVDRNENSYDNTIIDKKRVIQQGYDIEVSTITNALLEDDVVDYNYILTGFYTS